MYAYSFLVDERKFHHHAHSDHLVGHFGLSALSMYGLFELQTSVLSTSVILYIYEITLLGKVHLESAELGEICVLYHLRMRTTININYHRVLLRRIEVQRLYESVVIVVLAVCALYCSEGNLGIGVCRGRICGCKEVGPFLAVS